MLLSIFRRDALTAGRATSLILMLEDRYCSMGLRVGLVYTYSVWALGVLVPVLILVAVLMPLLVLSSLHTSVVKRVNPGICAARHPSLVGRNALTLVQSLVGLRIRALEGLTFRLHAY